MTFKFIVLSILLFGWNAVFSIQANNQFEITILSAALSNHNVPNKDIQGCTISGYHWASYLVAEIKVSNTGQPHPEKEGK
jgi:hypothetical protein